VTALKVIALVLILAGVAGLVYGNFTYTKATHEAKVGPFDFAVKEKKTVNVPLWAGIGAIVAGVVLFALPKRT
jgi:uncharacterized membrane protein YidH (DUF202 family)